MAQQIPLSRGLFAIVDDELYPILSRYKWHVVTGKRKRYARRFDKEQNKYHYMHLEIIRRYVEFASSRFRWPLPENVTAFHHNGDGIDNRCDNLIICTRETLTEWLAYRHSKLKRFYSHDCPTLRQ